MLVPVVSPEKYAFHRGYMQRGDCTNYGRRSQCQKLGSIVTGTGCFPSQGALQMPCIRSSLIHSGQGEVLTIAQRRTQQDFAASTGQVRIRAQYGDTVWRS